LLISALTLFVLATAPLLSQKSSSTETGTESESEQCQKMEVDNVRELLDGDSGIENMEVEEMKEILSPVEVPYA
jgi:hypothetical protein